MSLIEYRPSLLANSLFAILFSLALQVHTILSFRWKRQWYIRLMIEGCAFEMFGYFCRIMMWAEPFSYSLFMMQSIFITIARLFFMIAIYLTLPEM